MTMPTEKLMKMYNSGECVYCGKVYIRKKWLINHLSKKHKDKEDELWK